jgi:hypothetical protein
LTANLVRRRRDQFGGWRGHRDLMSYSVDAGDDMLGGCVCGAFSMAGSQICHPSSILAGLTLKGALRDRLLVVFRPLDIVHKWQLLPQSEWRGCRGGGAGGYDGSIRKRDAFPNAMPRGCKSYCIRECLSFTVLQKLPPSPRARIGNLPEFRFEIRTVDRLFEKLWHPVFSTSLARPTSRLHMLFHSRFRGAQM